MERWSAAHRWVERAHSYDAHLELEARKSGEAKHFEELALYQDRQRRLGIATTKRAIALLEKAGARLDALNTGEIEPRDLPNFFRAAVVLAEAGTNAEASALAVAELLSLLPREALSDARG
jgi:hypothetical protein